MALAPIHLISPVMFCSYQTWHLHCKVPNTLKSLFALIFYFGGLNFFFQKCRAGRSQCTSCAQSLHKDNRSFTSGFLLLLQLFITKKCSLLLGSRAVVPDFKHLYVHATSTFSSSILPPLGINTMSLLLRSMCLGPPRQMGEVWMIDVEQGVRETWEKCHKGQGGTGMVAKLKRRQGAQKSQELSRKQHILTVCG